MTDILDHPTTGDLAAYKVGRAVSHTHMLRYMQDVNHLLGYSPQTICAQRFIYDASTSRTTWVSYTRNPGVSVLMVEMEPMKAAAVGGNGTVTVTSSAGVIAWISGTAANPFNGTASAFQAGSGEVTLARQRYRAFLDVTGLTVGTTYDLKFAYADVSNSRGIAKLTIIEVPIASTDPVRNPTTDIGMDGDGYYQGRGITSNTTTSGRGFARLWNQTDKARYQNRRQWQILTSELDADAFQTNSASYASMNDTLFGTRSPTYRFRARRLYKTTDNNVYTLAFRYRVSAGTGGLRMLVDGVSTSIGSLASTSYTEATAALNIPCSGATDQEVTLQVEGKCSGGGTIYCTRARLLENES